MVYGLIKDLIPTKTCLKERNDGEFLIICNNDLSIYYLNEAAKDFYQMINGHYTIDEIVSRLVEVYDVDLSILQMDMLHLVRDLQWKHLLILKDQL